MIFKSGETVDLVVKRTAPMVPQPAKGATYDALLNKKKKLQKVKEIHDFIRDRIFHKEKSSNNESLRQLGDATVQP